MIILDPKDPKSFMLYVLALDQNVEVALGKTDTDPLVYVDALVKNEAFLQHVRRFFTTKMSFKELVEELRLFSQSDSESARDYFLLLYTNPVFKNNFNNRKLGETQEWADAQHAKIATQRERFHKLLNAENKKTAADQGSTDLGIDKAFDGRVVTRFPPEPSGYMHIGHAKALFLNELVARSFHGRLVLRFDDTNPKKATQEFEDSITEEVARLGVVPDRTTHTSDYFDLLMDRARDLIHDGNAYVDDTPTEQMREQRATYTASPGRSASVEKNQRRFAEMLAGTAHGCCLRAKIDLASKNRALADPVLYRMDATPHYRTGTKYAAYPTYDFACPIVDSVEGITHTLRTNEYHDRNAQYYWLLDALRLENRPIVWDYSRINMNYVLVSKRKLTKIVESGRVSGWSDPRMPTIRGLLARGLCVEALRSYIVSQGASKNAISLDWDKLWAINKKTISTVKTFTGFPVAKSRKAVIREEGEQREVVVFERDVASLLVGETVVLLNSGTASVESTEPLVFERKELARTNVRSYVSWIAESHKVTVFLFDFLLKTKKLNEDASLEEQLNEETKVRYEFYASKKEMEVEEGRWVNIEKHGLFYCTQIDGIRSFVYVPDGSQESIKPGFRF